MDRSQTIGFALLMLLFLGWMYSTKPTPEQLERQKFLQDSIAQVKINQEKLAAGEIIETSDAQNVTQAVEQNDSLATQRLNQQYGD